MDEGKEKDPFLLILTPAKSLNYLNAGGARERLLELLAPHLEVGTRSESYWRARDYYLSADDPSQNFLLRRVMAHEGIEQSVVCELITEALRANRNLRDLEHEVIVHCLVKCAALKEILDGKLTAEEQARRLTSVLNIEDEERIRLDLERFPIGAQAADEERSDLDDSGRLSAVRLTSIAGAKGLSADHVLVLGCDDVNLQRIKRSAFFVTLTRARKTLTLMASIGGGGARLLHDFVLALPEDHTEALYAKAHGVIEPYVTLQELQEHLGRWQYAKEQAKRPRR